MTAKMPVFIITGFSCLYKKLQSPSDSSSTGILSFLLAGSQQASWVLSEAPQSIARLEPELDPSGFLQFHFRASTPFLHMTNQRIWRQHTTCEIGPFSRNGTWQLGVRPLFAEIFSPLCYFCSFIFILLNLLFPLFLLPLCVYFYFYLQGLLFF